MASTRERFQSISELLLREQINRHDRGHQLRTTINAVKAMRALGFDHREIIQAAAGALVHDIGYNQPDDARHSIRPDDYHGGNRAKFKKHALHGAREAREKLTRILEVVKKRGERASMLKRLITYKDDQGQEQMMDELDIDMITEVILNHNDYGKDEADYNPRQVGRGALMVQLFDKLDICRQRVYEEHMIPSAFIKDAENFDPKYFHRTVPYCVKNYSFSIDPEDGVMKMVYQVDLEGFRRMMKKEYPDFEYTEETFMAEFKQAYAKNCQIAAEAMGVITDRPTNQQALIVELKFKDGKKEELVFARPARRMYEENKESLSVRLAELLKAKNPDTPVPDCD